jgi:hypothetical protein
MVSLPLEWHQEVLDLGHIVGNIASPAVDTVSQNSEEK